MFEKTTAEIQHIPSHNIRLLPDSYPRYYDQAAILWETAHLDTGNWRLVYRERKEQVLLPNDSLPQIAEGGNYPELHVSPMTPPKLLKLDNTLKGMSEVKAPI